MDNLYYFEHSTLWTGIQSWIPFPVDPLVLGIIVVALIAWSIDRAIRSDG